MISSTAVEILSSELIQRVASPALKCDNESATTETTEVGNGGWLQNKDSGWVETIEPVSWVDTLSPTIPIKSWAGETIDPIVPSEWRETFEPVVPEGWVSITEPVFPAEWAEQVPATSRAAEYLNEEDAFGNKDESAAASAQETYWEKQIVSYIPDSSASAVEEEVQELATTNEEAFAFGFGATPSVEIYETPKAEYTNEDAFRFLDEVLTVEAETQEEINEPQVLLDDFNSSWRVMPRGLNRC